MYLLWRGGAAERHAAIVFFIILNETDVSYQSESFELIENIISFLSSFFRCLEYLDIWILCLENRSSLSLIIYLFETTRNVFAKCIYSNINCIFNMDVTEKNTFWYKENKKKITFNYKIKIRSKNFKSAFFLSFFRVIFLILKYFTLYMCLNLEIFEFTHFLKIYIFCNQQIIFMLFWIIIKNKSFKK